MSSILNSNVLIKQIKCLLQDAILREREECAKICEQLAELSRETETDSMGQWLECASAIRNRGE